MVVAYALVGAMRIMALDRIRLRCERAYIDRDVFRFTPRQRQVHPRVRNQAASAASAAGASRIAESSMQNRSNRMIPASASNTKRVVECLCSFPQHITVFCIGRRDLRDRSGQIL